jgi:Brp/Blh family beta-carotene 15,15'-monooxygenase
MIGGTLLVILLFVSMTTWWLLAPGWAEWGALALMICAGIPHGSFDLRVAKAKWRDAPLSQKKIVALYLGGVVGMGGLCVFAPLIGLPLFLCISAIHFSEGEIHATTLPSNVAGTAYGVSAILLPIGLHVQEAQGYMGYFVPPEIFSSIEPPLVFVSYALALLLGILISASLISTKGTDRAEHLQRLICLGAWIILPPLSGFAVWFIGRHSLKHLQSCSEMFAGSRFGVPLDFALISLLAILGLLPFALRFDFSRIEDLFAASICLIAGLTLPHMIVSHRMSEIVPPRRNTPA